MARIRLRPFRVNLLRRSSRGIVSIELESFSDAQYDSYGSPSVTFYPTLDASASLQSIGDVVILPQSTVTIAGQIASIQFYASAAGSVTIYVSEKHALRSSRDTDTRNDHSSCFVVFVLLRQSIVTIRTCVELATLRIRCNAHQVSTQQSVVPA